MRYLRRGGDPIESEDLRSAILESSTSLSASRINQFLQCPRLYFILNTIAPRGPRPSLEERLGYPEIGSILAILRESGAALSAMSGSGAACFALYGERDGAEEVHRLFTGKGLFAEIVRPVDRTVVLLGEGHER